MGPIDGELELLQAVIAGRPGAWNTFFARYERLVVACIRKVLHRYGVVSHDEVEDIVNTVCLQLVRDDYHKLRAFDAQRGYRLSSWIGLIATNSAHDALRRRGPATYSIDDTDSAFHETADDRPSPADQALLREQAGVLNAAVRELSPSEQLFLRYYYQEELEPDEIATLLGISVNTVYSRKNKVRASLRRIVERRAAADARRSSPSVGVGAKGHDDLD